MWGRAQQASIEAVGPAVIRTLNFSAQNCLPLVNIGGCPVAANVIESLYRAGVATNDDDTFARDVAKKIIAGVRDVVRPSAQIQSSKKKLSISRRKKRVSV